MTRDDIIRMAQECHLIGMRPHLDGIYQQSLEHFATLIASAEREACARVCEAERERLFEWGHGVQVITADKLAVAIRARGEK